MMALSYWGKHFNVSNKFWVICDKKVNQGWALEGPKMGRFIYKVTR